MSFWNGWWLERTSHFAWLKQVTFHLLKNCFDWEFLRIDSNFIDWSDSFLVLRSCHLQTFRVISWIGCQCQFSFVRRFWVRRIVWGKGFICFAFVFGHFKRVFLYGFFQESLNFPLTSSAMGSPKTCLILVSFYWDLTGLVIWTFRTF